jgi:hypothetical protein
MKSGASWLFWHTEVTDGYQRHHQWFQGLIYTAVNPKKAGELEMRQSGE